jgi:hypothetical protein
MKIFYTPARSRKIKLPISYWLGDSLFVFDACVMSGYREKPASIFVFNKGKINCLIQDKINDSYSPVVFDGFLYFIENNKIKKCKFEDIKNAKAQKKAK